MPAGTPYALGRFRGSAGEDFCGVVIGPDVVPLAALHPAATGIESRLTAWPSNEKFLGAAVDDFVPSRADRSGSSGRHRADAVRSAEEVPAPLVPEPTDLRIMLKLNGETMQDETTADMISGIAELIAHVSSITPLRPGDLLLTGSPAGNGAHYGRYLREGEVMESTITGLGVQRNRCVQP
jgi:hypothetical protein